MSAARTVYIVDDNADFLESTRFWLQGFGFEVQAFGDPREALQRLVGRDRTLPACLMLDIRMPQMSGLDLHDALLAQDAALPVVYMSGHADVPLAVQAMQKGAVTLLEKPFDDNALERALDSAFSAPRPAPVHPAASDAAPAAPSAAAAPTDPAAHARFQALEARLTPREREVLGFVIQGIYNKNIADRIGLSIKTVELYRARGMAKLQAKSVAQLTRMMVSQQA